MRDSQKSKVYKWERRVCQELGRRVVLTSSEREDGEYYSHQWWDPNAEVSRQRTLDEVREVIYKMRWQAEMKKSPKTTVGNTTSGGAWWRMWENRIHFGGPNSVNYWVATHEMCHAILDYHRSYFQFAISNHGPEFVGLLMHFAERNLKVERKLMTRLANETGVNFVRLHVNLFHNR